MKCLRILFFISLCFAFIKVGAQQVSSATEQQLESLSDATESETEDDTYLQQLAHYLKHPLNINTATAEELQLFKILNPLQVHHFIEYRRLLGRFLSIYELQAIPGWDLMTIRKVLPYITLVKGVEDQVWSRFLTGEHTIMGRAVAVLEKQKGFDTTLRTHYLGSREHLQWRYKYQYKNLLQYGFTTDKDAGEPLYKNSSIGFDFYSFHFFARKLGVVKALALGDFTVNMGQGLIQWQSLAFGKSAEVMAVARQSAVLMPYNSAGEFYFNRGAGVTVQKGKIEATVFASLRKLSANTVWDTASNAVYFTSFVTSGLHRTQSELADKNSIAQTSWGGAVHYKTNRFKVGLNAVHYQFSNPLQKSPEPYNLYAISGRQWMNASMDYAFTHQNLHIFGEAAVDQKGNKAFLNSLLVSVDPKVDVSLQYRHIQPAYAALYGNAFTESTQPANESGVYTGINIRPATGWRLAAYADVYRFAWLRYRTDAPGNGQDYLVHLAYQPNKQLEVYVRYRHESKSINEGANNGTINYIVARPRQSSRVHTAYKLNDLVTVKARMETVWFDKKGKRPEEGFLLYLEGVCRPVPSFSVNARLQYFETGGYNSRIYAYEADVLYSYSIPAFFDKGVRYYCTLHYNFSKSVSFWLRWAQTAYNNKEVNGSGLNEIKGNKRNEVKVQLRIVI